MKKIISILMSVAALSSATAKNRFFEAVWTASCSAETVSVCTVAVSSSVSGDEIVSRMTAAVKALGSYSVAFSVKAGEYAARGRYTVVGDGYHLSLGDVEVFCDGKVRREVNRAVREIMIDAVDVSSRNILNNPARGFDFLGTEFRAELLSESDGTCIVRLTPAVGAADCIIDVTVGAADYLPCKLIYRLGGDTVAIDILHIASASKSLPSFDPSAFSGFEIIDFR